MPFLAVLWVSGGFFSGWLFLKSKKEKNDREAIEKSDTRFKFDYHLLEAQRLKLLGKYEEALRELENAKQYKDDEAVLFYELAEINSQNGYYSDAVKYGKKAVNDMQIPDGKKYTGLNMNKICMKKIAYDDVIDKEYQEKIMKLWEKDRENPYIYHNRLYTEVLLSDITDEYVREELQEEIPRAFEGEEYEAERKEILNEL